MYYSAFNQTIYVNQLTLTGNHDGSSWDDAFVDLQDALAIATEGAQIWVAQGIYLPSQDTTQNISFELEDGVELYGGFFGNETDLLERNWEDYPTILSGDLEQNDSLDFTNMEDNSYCVIYTNKVSDTTVLDGFIISGGYANDTSASPQSRGQSGGAWFNRGTFGVSNPSIRNCLFTNNQANYYGGVLYNNGGFNGQTNIAFENCQFIHNRSRESGGGIYNQGNFGGESSPSFKHCTFRDNTSMEGSGGLFYNNGTDGISSPVYINCEFSDNRSSSYGGVAFNMGKDLGNCRPVFINCLFLRNKALSAGVMYNLGSEDGQSNPQLINCTLYDNFGDVSAGALNNNGGGAEDMGTSEATVKNCIFWNNRTNGIGAVFKNNNGSVIVENCLMSAADCDALNAGTGSVTTCNVMTVFDVDPMFVDTTNGDFSLLLASPAHNMGDNNSLPTDVMEDLAGQERISEDTVDIGAYEICGAPCAVLSAELLTFTAVANLQESVDLFWTTVSEQDLAFFELERSVDARFFETIKRVTAVGITTKTQLYSFKDNFALNGNNYYRLKMVNRDGTFEYSEIQIVNFVKGDGVMTIYPNPNSGQFRINVTNKNDELESVAVYSALGILLYENRNVEKMDLRDFGAGVYWIFVRIEGTVYKERIVVK